MPSTSSHAVSCTQVILSLEMHCSLPQQERIAAILREVLGERLHLPPSAAAAAALSPAELRGKVIVKGKRLPFLLSQDISRDQLEQGRAEHDSDDSHEDEARRAPRRAAPPLAPPAAAPRRRDAATPRRCPLRPATVRAQPPPRSLGRTIPSAPC